MRTIKFRGKTLNQKWVYGDLLHYTNRSESNDDSIIVTDNNFNIVTPETVSQFTGLLDKNAKEIYEWDIVRKKEIGGYGLERIGVVRYYEKDCRFGIDFTATDKFWKRGLFIEGETQMEDGHCTHTYTLEYEVLGNIFDNSELLKNL